MGFKSKVSGSDGSGEPSTFGNEHAGAEFEHGRTPLGGASARDSSVSVSVKTSFKLGAGIAGIGANTSHQLSTDITTTKIDVAVFGFKGSFNIVDGPNGTDLSVSKIGFGYILGGHES